MRLLLYVVPIVLVIYALIDCMQTPGDLARSIPKPLWLLLIAFIPILGALAWLTLGRPRDGEFGNGSGGGGSRGSASGPRLPGLPGRRRGPVAPDDDESFLRELEDKAWQEKMRQRRGEAGTPATDDSDQPTP